MKRRWTERDEEGGEVNDGYILLLLYVEMLLRQCVVDDELVMLEDSVYYL